MGYDGDVATSGTARHYRYRFSYPSPAGTTPDSALIASAGANLIWQKQAMRCTYMQSGKAFKDSLFQYVGTNAYAWDELFSNYQYNASGRSLGHEVYQPGGLLTDSNIKTFRERYSYYADGRLKTSGIEYLKPQGWQPVSQDSFAYVGTSVYPVYQDTKGFDTAQNAWKSPFQKCYARLRPDGYPDSITIIRFVDSSYSPSYVAKYDFDSYGRPIRGITKNFNRSGNTFLPGQTTERWYYGGAASVIDWDRHSLLKMYPNPARAQLWIDAADGIAAKDLPEIFNASGQQMRLRIVVQQSGWVVSVEGLAPGQYWVRWTTGHGEVVTGSFLRE